MKFDTRTIQVLKNFSSINPSMVFKEGNTLATINPSKSVMARAKAAVEFPGTFAIYDLSRFLSTVSLFSDPEFKIQEKYMEIRQGSKKLNYTFTEPSLVVAPPEKDIKLPDPEVKFRVTADDLQEVMKALSTLGLPEIAVVGDGNTICLQAIDSKNPSGDVYSVEVGPTNAIFKMIIRAENMKLLPGDYDVEISSKALSYFKGVDVEYWIAVEQNSSFEG